MSTFTFKCLNCEHHFSMEATIREKERNQFICPQCKSPKTKQKFSIFNFIKNIFESNNNSASCCSGDGNKNKEGCDRDNGKCCP